MREIRDGLAHRGTVALETPRLILRRADMGDCRAVHDNLTTDPDIVEYVGWDDCRHFEDTQRRIGELVRSYDDPSVYNWLIAEKDSGEVVGSIYVSVLIEKRRTAEIDYGVAKHYRGKAYAPEALAAVIDFLFFDAGFYRIEAQCNTDNPASARVMVKAGMRFEGTMRGRAMRMNEAGLPADILLYGVVAADMLNK